jgi:thiamine biosynthesis protein ThiI
MAPEKAILDIRSHIWCKEMRVLLLISGGIDSPVAGYIAKQMGLEVIAVHFSNTKFAGRESVEKCERLAKKLDIKGLTVIDISEQLAELAKKCEHRYYFVLMKRFMLRLAEKIAEKENCDFLATGENLGQVSSQTLENLAVIDKTTKLHVLRPLITYDKVDIINKAEKIGTFELSKGPEMCDVLGPKHPSTRAKESIILEEEAKLDYEKMLADALAQI